MLRQLRYRGQSTREWNGPGHIALSIAQGTAVRKNWTTVAIATVALWSPRKVDDIPIEGCERMLRNL
jgi:hypothetical protein